MCGAGVVDLCAAAIRVVVAMYGGDRRGAGREQAGEDEMPMDLPGATSPGPASA